MRNQSWWESMKSKHNFLFSMFYFWCPCPNSEHQILQITIALFDIQIWTREINVDCEENWINLRMEVMRKKSVHARTLCFFMFGTWSWGPNKKIKDTHAHIHNTQASVVLLSCCMLYRTVQYGSLRVRKNLNSSLRTKGHNDGRRDLWEIEHAISE